MSKSRLTFIRHTDKLNSKGKKVFALYLCACGNTCETRYSAVNTGNTKSCGCLQSETRLTAQKTHGLRYHPLYAVWLNMRQRCSNPNLACYKYYGGRGINVCKRWDSFETFYNDVIKDYAPHLELDRKDNDKGYSPENVQWVTHKRNSQKRKYCKLNQHKASFIRQSNLAVNELAEMFKVSKRTVSLVLSNQIWK